MVCSVTFATVFGLCPGFGDGAAPCLACASIAASTATSPGLRPFVYTSDIAGRPHVYHPGAGNACEQYYVDGRLAPGMNAFAW
jgi:hypothetical protein